MGEPAHSPLMDELAILRRRPLLLAAFVSVVTVIVLLPWLVVAAFALGAIGLTRAAFAPSPEAAVRAAGLTSVAFGLAVGPAVYMLLAAVVRVI